MLQRRFLLLLLSLSALLFAPRLRAQTVTGTCLPTDSISTRIVRLFQSFISGSTPEDSTMRSTLGLNAVTSSEVVVVTADSVCSRAAMAMDAQRDEKSTSYSLYVVALGTSYAVVDTTGTRRGYTPAWVFDQNWNFISAVQAF